MSSLLMSRSAIYSSSFSNHNLSVYLKVGKYQGSVLSPLLFGDVMDVVPSEARSGIPSELMYADDLFLMVMVSSSEYYCKLWKVTLLSAHYVKGGFTNSIAVYVVTCHW